MECNTSSIKTSFQKIRLTENSNKFYLTYQVHKTRIDLSEILQNPGNTSPDLS